VDGNPSWGRSSKCPFEFTRSSVDAMAESYAAVVANAFCASRHLVAEESCPPEFAISCAPVPGKVQVLRGTEDMLLWRHRIKTGLSTEANSGRFYPGCARSTNRWIVRKGARAGGRTPGRIAQPLPAGVAPPDFGLVTPPVQGDRGVLQAPWWQRESLADGPSIPSSAGVYRIYFLITRDVVRGKRGRLNTEYSGFEDKLYLLPERSGEWKDQPETILQPAPPGLNFSTCDGLTRTVAIKSVS